MEWTVSQSRFRGPVKLGFMVLSSGGYYGGDVAYLPEETGTPEKYVIAGGILNHVKIGTELCLRQIGTVNGKVWFKGNYLVYYTAKYGYIAVLTTAGFPGWPPVEYKEYNAVSETWEWKGDAFYSGVLPLNTDTEPKVFVGRGSLKVESGTQVTKQATTYFPRWEKTSDFLNPTGKYAAVVGSGVTGTRTIGVAQWKDGNEKTYDKSVRKTSGRYTYGSIYFNVYKNKWVIGSPDNPAGWWEGTEPQVENGVTFVFKVPDESGITGSDIVLYWVGYVLGNEKKTIHLAELGVYR